MHWNNNTKSETGISNSPFIIDSFFTFTINHVKNLIKAFRLSIFTNE